MLLFLGESDGEPAPPACDWPLVAGAPSQAAFQSFWLLLGIKTLRQFDENVTDLKPCFCSLSLFLPASLTLSLCPL